MTWTIALQLLIKYGPDAVKNLMDIIKSHPEPTKEAWDKVLILALKPMSEYEKEAEQRKLENLAKIT